MAYSHLFTCDRCDHDIVLVHAEEWQADANGEICPYTGIGRIGGLANRLWCPACRVVRPFAFVRLNPPAEHAVIAYAEAQRLGRTGNETGPCPVCGETLTWNVEGTACPGCANGILRLVGEWEDAV